MKAKSWYFWWYFLSPYNKHLTKWMGMYNNYIARLNTLLFAFEPKMVAIDRSNSQYCNKKCHLNVMYCNSDSHCGLPRENKTKSLFKARICFFFKRKWEAVMRIIIVICWRFWYQPVFTPKILQRLQYSQPQISCKHFTTHNPSIFSMQQTLKIFIARWWLKFPWRDLPSKHFKIYIWCFN